MQARFRFTSGMARLSLRQSEAGSYTALLDASGQVALYRGEQLMGAAAVTPSAPDGWRTLRLSAINDVVRVAVDGVEVIAAQDPAPLPAGTLSFASVGQNTLAVDDVEISWLDNTVMVVMEAATPTAAPVLFYTPTPDGLEGSYRNAARSRAMAAEDTGTTIFRYVSDAAGLRAAIIDANNDTGNTHVLNLASGRYTAFDEHGNFSANHITGRVIIVGRESYNMGIHPAELPENQQVIIELDDSAPTLDVFRNDTYLTLYNVVVRNGGGDDRWGGGGFVNGGLLEIYNTLIVDNKALDPGGGVGAGIFNNTSGVVHLINTVFRNNQGTMTNTGHGGGAISNDGGIVEGNCVTFDSNRASYGGAVENFTTRSIPTGTINLQNVNFISNLAYRYGAVYRDAGTGPITIVPTTSYWNPPFSTIPTNLNSSNVVVPTPHASALIPLNCAVPPAPVDICQPSGSAMQAQLALTSPTCSEEDILLNDYRVKIVHPVYDSQGTPVPDPRNPSEWTTQQITDLYTAVTNTARALKFFTNQVDPSDTSTPEQIFVRVMVGNSANVIEVVVQNSAINCITNKPDPEPGITARITCHASANEFTLTHELGHIFVGRTSVSGNQSGNATFYGLIERPTTSGALQLSSQYIFGTRSYFVVVPPPAPTPTYVLPYPSDWQRGDRGWGTGSDLLTPLAPSPEDVKPAYEIGAKIPLPTEIYVGPCVAGGTSGDRGLPTQYQQNPCHVKDWVIRNPGWYSTPVPNLGPILETEIEETAGDMFLNWVYDNQGGFEDKIWQDRTTSVGDEIHSGVVRSDWMNCALTRMFNLKSFWRASNLLFNFPSTPDFECQRFPGLLAYDQQ